MAEITSSAEGMGTHSIELTQQARNRQTCRIISLQKGLCPEQMLQSWNVDKTACLPGHEEQERAAGLDLYCEKNDRPKMQQATP